MPRLSGSEMQRKRREGWSMGAVVLLVPVEPLKNSLAAFEGSPKGGCVMGEGAQSPLPTVKPAGDVFLAALVP